MDIGIVNSMFVQEIFVIGEFVGYFMFPFGEWILRFAMKFLNRFIASGVFPFSHWQYPEFSQSPFSTSLSAVNLLYSFSACSYLPSPIRVHASTRFTDIESGHSMSRR